jgi:hypothetical protein
VRQFPRDLRDSSYARTSAAGAKGNGVEIQHVDPGTALAVAIRKRGFMQQSATEDLLDWVRLIQSEYAEMPGLHLSKRQAQRLWNLDARSTDAIFGALEASSFLRRMPNDVYIRADVGY